MDVEAFKATSLTQTWKSTGLPLRTEVKIEVACHLPIFAVDAVLM